MGGNIGVPVLQLPPPSRDRVHVVECSSFQIDLAPSLAPTAGILMNLTPDHLDRHGTMDNYAAIKARLVAGARTPIVSIDDPDSAAIARRLEAAGRPVEAISVAGKALTTGVSLDGTMLFRHRAGTVTPFADLAGIPALRGAHNAQNAAAAALALGADGDDLARLQDAAALVPRPRPSHGAGGPSRLRAVHQRFQGDQRGRGGKGAAVVSARALDHRR